jgi:hypothetical protein
MNIIYEIIKQVQEQKLYGVSNNIELCKGKNKIPESATEKKEQIKRRFIFLLKK